LPPGTGFGSITIEAPGYTLSGAALGLSGGVTTTYSSGVSIDSIDTEMGAGLVNVGAGGEIDFDGVLSGSTGFRVSDGGVLVLGGSASNTYAGATIDGDSTLVLSKSAGSTAVPGDMVIGSGAAGALVQESAPDQISDTANVTVNAGATLDLNDQDDSIGGLLLQGGAVTTGAATLTLGGGVTGTDPGNSGLSPLPPQPDPHAATRAPPLAARPPPR